MNIFITNVLMVMCSIFVEYIIIRYYTYRRMLPLIKNRIFWKTVKVMFLGAFINAMAISFYFIPVNTITIKLHYLVDILYYIVYELIFISVIIYMISYIKGDEFVTNLRFIRKYENIKSLLVFLIAVLVYLAVYNGVICNIDENGVFHCGKYYALINVFPFTVLITMLLNLFRKRKGHFDEKDRGVIYAIIILLIGITVDMAIKNIFILDTAFCISILVLYISGENPDFFISENMKAYNSYAFMNFIDEFVSARKDVYIFGIYIKNFASLKSRYGTKNIYRAFEMLSSWLIKTYSDDYVFYTDNRCFNIVSMTPFNTNVEIARLYNRFKKPFESQNMSVFFWPEFFEIERSIKNISPSDILNAEIYAMDRSYEKGSLVKIDYEIFEKIDREKRIQDILQDCIDREEIEIYIQPIYCTRTEKIAGGEVLARIIHGKYGFIKPTEFIPVAERSGKIIQLGTIIFEKTCRYIATHNLNEMGISFINVNISPVQFQNINLVEEFKSIADRYNVDFSIFDFEITETAANSENLIMYHLENFRKYKASVSIDDFGEGSSNISRLTEYKFNLAKIDMSLVWDYFNGKNTIIKDIVSIFKSENLEIVAEGVETEKMVKSLTKMGCEYLQGFYFSKPISVDKFTEYVKDFNASNL